MYGKENNPIKNLHSAMYRKIKRGEIELPDYYEPTKDYFIVSNLPTPIVRQKKYPKMYKPEFRKRYIVPDKDTPFPIGSSIPTYHPDNYKKSIYWCMAGEEGIKVGDKVIFKNDQNVEVIKYERNT